MPTASELVSEVDLELLSAQEPYRSLFAEPKPGAKKYRDVHRSNLMREEGFPQCTRTSHKHVGNML